MSLPIISYAFVHYVNEDKNVQWVGPIELGKMVGGSFIFTLNLHQSHKVFCSNKVFNYAIWGY